MNNFKDKLQKLEEAISLFRVYHFTHNKGKFSRDMIEKIVDWVANEDGDGNVYMTVESMWVLTDTLIVYPMGGGPAPGLKQFAKELKLNFGIYMIKPRMVL